MRLAAPFASTSFSASCRRTYLAQPSRGHSNSPAMPALPADLRCSRSWLIHFRRRRFFRHEAGRRASKNRHLADSTFARCWSMNLQQDHLRHRSYFVRGCTSCPSAQPINPMVDMQRLATVELCSMSAPVFLAAAIATVQSIAVRARHTQESIA